MALSRYPLRLVALGAVIGTSAVAAEPTFTDPAPPALPNIAHDPATPPATPNPDVTFHAAPRPLDSAATTQDWPNFLGPTHDDVSAETHLLSHFPPGGPAIVWEMTKGQGYAQPVIAGDRLILLHRIDDNEVVDCLKPDTGERYWRVSYPTTYQDRYGYCDGPRSTPAIANGRVFTVGAQGQLHCLDLRTGQVYWRRNLLKEFKLKPNFFGVGASPLVDQDRVIINVGAPGGPCVAAFDAHSGKMLWGAGDEWGPSYATPVPGDVWGKHCIFVFAGGESRPPTGGLLCIDPATGHVDFSFPWRGTRHESVNASSPVVQGNHVFVSECYGSGGAMLDILPDLTCTVAWTSERFGTHFMNALRIDDFLYGVDGHGPADAFFCCENARTGKELWRTQPEWTDKLGDREIPLGTYRCNLLRVDGRCLCLGEYGHLLWLDLNPAGYKSVDRVWLIHAGQTWTPPVVSKGLLYVCQNEIGAGKEPLRLICYDLRGGGVK